MCITYVLLMYYLCFTYVFVFWVLWTFWCTEKFTVINSKSNMERFIFGCIFTENKFRLPPWSLLIKLTITLGNISIHQYQQEIIVHILFTISKKLRSLPQHIVLYWGHSLYPHPLSISLWIRNKAGWYHSVFPLRICTSLLLIRTASLTCLVKQSLVFATTSALYLAISPWWAAAWCLTMKDVCSPDLYL